MTPERLREIEDLYHAARECNESQRRALLDQADLELREHVESLLALGNLESPIDRPIASVAAKVIMGSGQFAPARSMIGRAISHYEIIEKIGEGGMGVVYRARDTHLDRFVAIKVLPPEKLSVLDRKRRFVQEARTASALNHPNIVHIYDIDQQDGVDYISMEYVEGRTLGETTGRQGLKLSEALKYAIQIADGLAGAHAAGIVHRDLKPGNVMVTTEGRVKVLDFGLAKLIETAAGPEDETDTTRQSTALGMVVGTAAYMSPEQAEGKTVDARSDIFSFGSVFYEMLTGRTAFRRDTPSLTLAAILHVEPPPLPAEIPEEIERFILRCLRKDPARRFQTMADLKVTLEEIKKESESGTLAPSPRAVAKSRKSSALGGRGSDSSGFDGGSDMEAPGGDVGTTTGFDHPGFTDYTTHFDGQCAEPRHFA
jgi:serine/threonine protein kinase